MLQLVADLTLQATNAVVFLPAKDYEALLNSKFASGITLASDFMSAMTGYVGKIANTALFTDMFEYPNDTFLEQEGFYYVYAKDEHGTPE